MLDLETYRDGFNLLCGKEIGEGIHRKVFECRICPEFVVKVENDDWRYFANVKEMTFWCDHKNYKKVADWLAPCKYLSPDGRVMLQRRADPLPASYEMPDKMPSFLTDLKRENYGLLNGRLVCIDYAMTIPNPSLRLRKAHW